MKTTITPENGESGLNGICSPIVRGISLDQRVKWRRRSVVRCTLAGCALLLFVSLGHASVTSLREAVSYATAGETITFDNTLSGSTLTLTHAGGQLIVNKSTPNDYFIGTTDVISEGKPGERS